MPFGSCCNQKGAHKKKEQYIIYDVMQELYIISSTIPLFSLSPVWASDYVFLKLGTVNMVYGMRLEVEAQLPM